MSKRGVWLGFASLILITSGGNSFAVGFEVEKKTADYEIRRYQASVVAETFVPAYTQNKLTVGFRHLEDYFHKGNKAELQLPLHSTASAMIEEMDDGLLIQFPLPEEYQVKNPPAPNSRRVQVRRLPNRRIAVQYLKESSAEKTGQTLLAAALRRDGVRFANRPQLVRFYSPECVWIFETEVEVAYPLED